MSDCTTEQTDNALWLHIGGWDSTADIDGILHPRIGPYVNIPFFLRVQQVRTAGYALLVKDYLGKVFCLQDSGGHQECENTATARG
jgi:hypothetical protein